MIFQALTENGDKESLNLGSWSGKDRDIRARKALTWKSRDKMDTIWRSKIDESLKIILCMVNTETILQRRKLSGIYTQRVKK